MTRDDPEYWRIRAEEARAMAEHMSLLESKETMLAIAADYDHLAGIAERRLRAAKK